LHTQLVTLGNRIIWHVANVAWGVVFLAALAVLSIWTAPDVAYALALLASTIAIYTPYALSYSYPNLNAVERARDVGIAAIGVGTVWVALVLSLVW
jgi:hypothetical protein